MTTERIIPEMGDDPLTNFLGGLLGTLGLALTIPPALASGQALQAQQSSMRDVRAQLLSLAETMDAHRRGLLSEEERYRILANLGYSDRAQEVIDALERALLGANESLTAWMRGYIDDAELSDRLGVLGYSESDQGRLRELTAYVPGPQDLIRMGVREVFKPDVRERFRQDADNPLDDPDGGERLRALLRANGISDETWRDLWAGHWELPSIQMAFEMLHRSHETGVTIEDIDTLLVAQDVMEFWREPLKAISYLPLTRVDVRRMHKLGVLDDEAVVIAYKAIGYNDENAERLLEFTKRLNEAEARDALEPFLSTLRTQARSLYLRGVLNEAELRETFAALGYTDEQIDAFVAEAEFVRSAELAEDISARVQALYVGGHWTSDQASQRLASAGFDQRDIGRLFQDWNLRLELREETEAERAEKDLTRADITGAFTEGVISRSEAEPMVKALGYDDAETELILDRIEFKKATAERKAAETRMKALYVAGRVDRGKVTAELDRVGVPAERREALLTEWTADAVLKVPTLTVAQIQAALKRSIIQEPEAVARLSDHGYTDEDVRILVELAKGAASVEPGA